MRGGRFYLPIPDSGVLRCRCLQAEGRHGVLDALPTVNPSTANVLTNSRSEAYDSRPSNPPDKPRKYDML